MVASSLAYSAIFGPAYGGMVGLIFIHECGHILAMRYFGLPFSPMLFIPFGRTVIQMQKRRRRPRSPPSSAWPGRSWAASRQARRPLRAARRARSY